LPLSNPYPIGSRVRHSAYAMQSPRDQWQREGNPARKNIYKAHYEKRLAERGTITEIHANGYSVLWDSGAVSRCLASRIDTEDSVLFRTSEKVTKPKRPKITKPQIKGLLEQLDNFATNASDRLQKLEPQFRDWITAELADIRECVISQEPWGGVQARARHMAGRLLDFETGRVTRVTRHADGNSSFEMAAK